MGKVLVTGAYGQLGMEMKKKSGSSPAHDFIFTDADSLDITDFNALETFFSGHEISTIVNCAAYTAVDKAESETGKATLVNSIAPAHLAELAVKHNSKLIHISTDYVFDGTSVIPYKETDAANPQSAYGLTKLGGETAVMNIMKDYVIIRTSWLYSRYGNNFVKTILKHGNEKDRLNVVYDQVGCPTHAKDLASVIFEILKAADQGNGAYKPGIYHYAGEGVCSWFDFAMEILQSASIQCKVNPIETKDYPLPAKRPCYSIFNKTKIKSEYNIEIPYWKDSLKECISNLVH